MYDDDELPPEAFEWRFSDKKGSTKRVYKKRRLDFLKADAELYNRLVAQYGRRVIDFLIEHGFTARAFIAEETSVLDDLDLWFEATGERVFELRDVERLALECWLWEKHDRKRQPGRFKPNKSPDDDAPWPGATNWHPRRWFCWKPPSWLPWAKLLLISTAGAKDRICHPEDLVPEDLLIRDCAEALVGWKRLSGPITRGQLATEVTGENFRRTKSGEWENETSWEWVPERKHPKPQGFWDV